MLNDIERNKLIAISDQAWAHAEQHLPHIVKLLQEIKPNTPDNTVIFIALSLVSAELYQRRTDRN